MISLKKSIDRPKGAAEEQFNLRFDKQVIPASIIGTGLSVPDTVIPNSYFVDELELDTSDQWIRDRIGIIERRFAKPDETLAQFASQAAIQAINNANCDPQDIDLILVATSTSDYVMPSTACMVQKEIGAINASAFDLSSACSGFAVAFDVATRYLMTGCKNVLVIGADISSRIIDMNDRNTCVFFGDGAGALLLSSEGEGGVLSSSFQSAGDSEALSVISGGKMKMNGPAIWDFATEILPKTISQLCEQSNLTPSDLDVIVPHQANYYILKSAADSLNIPVDRFSMNLQKYGNTMAASIPMALHEAMTNGEAIPGNRMAIVGFGAGLTWGGSIIQL